MLVIVLAIMCNIAVVLSTHYCVDFVLFSFADTRGDYPYLVEVSSFFIVVLFVDSAYFMVASTGFEFIS